jgi:hypothetical protein
VSPDSSLDGGGVQAYKGAGPKGWGVKGMAKGKSRDKSKEALWRRTVRQTPTITSFGLGRPLLKPPNGLFWMDNRDAGQEARACRASDKRSLKSVQS